jgi:hypothetical protein
MMKTGLSLFVTLAPLMVALASGENSQTRNPDPAATVSPNKISPFYCNIGALNPAERKRHFDELGPQLRLLRKNVRELENGYEFEYPGDAATYQLLTEWAIQERRCCPFFEIALRLEAEDGSIWLRLTGRPGTKEFIKVDAPSWVKQ